MKSLRLKIYESLQKRGLINEGKVDDKISATVLVEIARECRCETIQVMSYIRYGIII